MTLDVYSSTMVSELVLRPLINVSVAQKAQGLGDRRAER